MLDTFLPFIPVVCKKRKVLNQSVMSDNKNMCYIILYFVKKITKLKSNFNDGQSSWVKVTPLVQPV